MGIVLVLLAQQLGYLSLSDLTPAVVDLAIGAIVGGVLFALVGWALGRRYLGKHPESDAPSPPA